MKKIVVVVGGGKTITFEGEELKISNTKAEGGLLIVQDMSRKGGEQQLAVFRSWQYWKEEEGTDEIVGYYETDVLINANSKVMIPITDRIMKRHPALLGSIKFCPLARYKLRKN